jgi:hypothetical protein
MNEGDSTNLVIVRTHCWRVWYLVDRRHKEQQAKQAGNHVSEFNCAVKQEETSALVRSAFLRRIIG